jgi:hypothetical protein
MRWPRVTALVLSGGLVLAGSSLLAGCGGSASHDQPALAAPTSSAPTPTTVSSAGVPNLSVLSVSEVEEPQLSPAAGAVNAGLQAVAASLADRHLACTVSAVRLDVALASFRWICVPLRSGRSAADQQIATATYDLVGGRRLTLGDRFTGGYLAALAATARTQLEAGGASSATATADVPATATGFAAWALDPDDLDVTFRVGGKPTTVQFPLESLTAYLPSGGLLKP